MKSTLTISLDTDLIELLRKEDNYSDAINQQLRGFYFGDRCDNIKILRENKREIEQKLKQMRKKAREIDKKLQKIVDNERKIAEKKKIIEVFPRYTKRKGRTIIHYD